jgi:hypothetical protein
VPLAVHDIDVVHRLRVVHQRPDGGDGLLAGRIGGHRHEGRGHQSAGGIGIVGGQFADLGGVLGAHPHQDLGNFRLGQNLEDVGRVVRIHAAQQGRRVGRGQGAHDHAASAETAPPSEREVRPGNH